MKTALLSDSAVQQLLAWFRREGKAYPWGEDITPYRIWISEVMLQQTVVTAAIPFFNRWMARFPDPAALAEAQEEEVLRYWEGLGYYSRGRNLLKAARVIRDERGGRLPEDLAGWRSLPGVGEYTARAVLSIAAGRPYPVLDANVRRIGRRILAAEVWEKGADGELLASLTECIPAEEPGTFNAALMQLGQLVCRTGTPDCPSCPLKEECEAHHRGTAPLIPEKKKRIITSLKSRRFLFFAGDRVFLIRRDAGIGKGLWILPGLPLGTEATPELPGLAAAEPPPGQYVQNGKSREDPRGITGEQTEFLVVVVDARHALHLQQQQRLKNRRHTYTRYREELEVEAVTLPAEASPFIIPELERVYGGGGWTGKWFSLPEAEDLPLPSVYRKILREGMEAFF